MKHCRNWIICLYISRDGHWICLHRLLGQMYNKPLDDVHSSEGSTQMWLRQIHHRTPLQVDHRLQHPFVHVARAYIAFIDAKFSEIWIYLSAGRQWKASCYVSTVWTPIILKLNVRPACVHFVDRSITLYYVRRHQKELLFTHTNLRHYFELGVNRRLACHQVNQVCSLIKTHDWPTTCSPSSSMPTVSFCLPPQPHLYWTGMETVTYAEFFVTPDLRWVSSLNRTLIICISTETDVK